MVFTVSADTAVADHLVEECRFPSLLAACKSPYFSSGFYSNSTEVTFEFFRVLAFALGSG